MLSRNQPNPGGQIAPGRERVPIPHLGHQSGRDYWTNARDCLKASALFTGSMPGMDASLDGAYLGRQSSILARQNIKTEPCR